MEGDFIRLEPAVADSNEPAQCGEAADPAAGLVPDEQVDGSSVDGRRSSASVASERARQRKHECGAGASSRAYVEGPAHSYC
jgi:hypothetical protein